MTGKLTEYYPSGSYVRFTRFRALDDFCFHFRSEYETIPDAKGREWREIAVIPYLDKSSLVLAYNEVGVFCIF
jgi:hypothetical protein